MKVVTKSWKEDGKIKGVVLSDESKLDRQELINRIKHGEEFRTENKNGPKVKVTKDGDLTTEQNRKTEDNLSELPNLKIRELVELKLSFNF